MPSAAEAHIAGQQRLRDRLLELIAAIWVGLGAYDEQQVPQFVGQAALTVAAAQRASVALTDAYIANAVGRQPLGIDATALIASLRGGTPAAEVYRRPFVTVWTDLSRGVPYPEAVHAGLARAQGTAAMDVQLAMRQTLREVAERDQVHVLGYSRVPDAGACSFCRLVAGQRYTRRDLMPLHNRCGCGVDVITADNRHLFTGNPANDLPEGVAVHEHGELGPVLGDPAHDFTSASDLSH